MSKEYEITILADKIVESDDKYYFVCNGMMVGFVYKKHARVG